MATCTCVYSAQDNLKCFCLWYWWWFSSCLLESATLELLFYPNMSLPFYTLPKASTAVIAEYSPCGPAHHNHSSIPAFSYQIFWEWTQKLSNVYSLYLCTVSACWKGSAWLWLAWMSTSQQDSLEQELLKMQWHFIHCKREMQHDHRYPAMCWNLIFLN